MFWWRILGNVIAGNAINSSGHIWMIGIDDHRRVTGGDLVG